MSITGNLYHLCRTSPINFRGKKRITDLLARRLTDKNKFLPWRLQNGTVIAIRPEEAGLDYGVAGECFMMGEWEPHIAKIIRDVLQAGDVAIDIGANIGVFTCLMSSLVGPMGKVHAFEPSLIAFEQLQESMRYNQIEGIVHAKQIALDDQPGRLHLHVPRSISGNASLFDRTRGVDVSTEIVKASTLDYELEDVDKSKIRLVKLDAEGAELRILSGARQILRESQASLIVEWNPETASLAGWSIRDLMDLMEQCGPYSARVIMGNGCLLGLDMNTLELESGSYVDLYFTSRASG